MTNMTGLTFVLVATLWYFSAVCEGGIHQITYNEDDLVGTCAGTCGDLPDRTDKFGCDRISNCRYQREGWDAGFVTCNWCICDCRTSDDLPQKEVIEETTKILTEDDLWGTCTRTCSATGLQKTNAFGCSEIRNCSLQKTGWIRGFVRCDYCECNCVIKGYPDNYRLENVKFNIDLSVTGEAVSVVVGKATVENHSSRAQTFTKTIETSLVTSRMWEKTSSTTLLVGAKVSIEAPILKVLTGTVEITSTFSKSKDYTWGETETKTIKYVTKQQVEVGPHCSMEASMLGTKNKASVPYTADLVTIYKGGKETRISISGILHEASVSNVHLVYGKCIPLPERRRYDLEA